MQSLLDEIISLSKTLALNNWSYAGEEREEMIRKQDRLFDILKETITYWWW